VAAAPARRACARPVASTTTAVVSLERQIRTWRLSWPGFGGDEYATPRCTVCPTAIGWPAPVMLGTTSLLFADCLERAGPAAGRAPGERRGSSPLHAARRRKGSSTGA
jgi:hypothetical protein